MLKVFPFIFLISGFCLNKAESAEPVTYTYWVAVDSFTQSDFNTFRSDGIMKSGRSFQETRLLPTGNTHYLVLEITPVPVALQNKYIAFVNQGKMWLSQTSVMDNGNMVRSGISYPPDYFPYKVEQSTP